MLQKFKDSSLITKLLYLVAFILFLVWVLPIIKSYYTNVNTYKTNMQEIKSLSSLHGLSTETQKFSESLFKKNTESLFSKVELNNLGENRYQVNITMKKEDLKSFHTFIETLSLQYYVEIKNDIKFTTQNEFINAQMTLKAF